MSLLHPLWLLWVDVPLALLAALLWWSVKHMDPVPPLVDIMAHPAVRRPITRSEMTNYHQVLPGFATSAVMSLTASYYDPRLHG